MSVTDHVVRYHEHISAKSFEELVAAFEAGIGDGSDTFKTAFVEASASENSREVFESIVNDSVGPVGFTWVFAADFRPLLRWYGASGKAKSWIYGNPMIAVSMAKEDIRVAGRVPLQILIFEGDDGKARIGYDLPSSVLGWLGNAEVDAVAQELDRKVVGFITEIAGVTA